MKAVHLNFTKLKYIFFNRY